MSVLENCIVGVLEPPRWDNARATATFTVVVPVLSLRNELLGALSAVLDLGSVKPRLQYIVRSSPAEVILLAADGKPLLGTQTAATALMPLGPQPLHHRVISYRPRVARSVLAAFAPS